MGNAAKFDWTLIDDAQFEELVLAIVQSKKPVRAEFRKGPGDKGRDIQAWFRNKDSLGLESDDRYFIEAKHHKSGVSSEHISGALAWAQSEQPNALVFAISSHFTNACRDNITAWKKNNPKVKVVIWERKELEQEILASKPLQDHAIALRILPSTIKALLPQNPEQSRPNIDAMDSGLEMGYRYWLREEDIDQLEGAAVFIESCGKILHEQDLAQEHFETACLGVPNWSTWLRLYRAGCLLQLAVRDYLYAQVTGASVEELKASAIRISERVKLIEETGKKSAHVD